MGRGTAGIVTISSPGVEKMYESNRVHEQCSECPSYQSEYSVLSAAHPSHSVWGSTTVSEPRTGTTNNVNFLLQTMLVGVCD